MIVEVNPENIYIVLGERLTIEISNQVKYPAIIISIDNTNYYNKIDHPVLSLSY